MAVSMNLVNLIADVYQQAIVEGAEEDGGQEEVLDVEQALKSPEFQKYLNACAELQEVDVLNLDRQQMIAFLLNVHQCMYVHYFLRRVYEGAGKEKGWRARGILAQISKYVVPDAFKPFCYNIGGSNFNLEEIKHGLLRNN